MPSIHLRELRPLPMSRWPTQGPVAKGVQLTLDGQVLTAMPTPLVEEYWVESYAKALLSGDLRVKITPAPSDALAQAMQEWAEMLLGNEENAQTAEAVQPKLEQAAEEEHIEFNSMADYYIAKVTADTMKTQPMDAESDNGTQDGSSSDSLFRPPAGDDLDIQQDLNEGANFDRYHYVNPHRDRDDDADIPLQAPIAVAGASPEVQAAAPSTDKCIVDCKSDSGKLFLMQGAVKFGTQASSAFTLDHLEPCPTHKFRRWVIAFISNAAIDNEEGFKELVTHEGFGTCPFFVGCRGVGGVSNEMCIIYQSRDSDKHKVKALSIEGACLQTFKKGGGQSQKIIETITTLRNGCEHFLTNLEVRKAEGGNDMEYEEALDTVADWGVDKLTAFIENAKLKKARDKPISGLEGVCLVSKASLMEVVKLRQDAGEFVFYLGSDRQRRHCPKVFDDGATENAKTLKVYVWNPTLKEFNVMSLRDWLDSEEHLLTALLLLGEGGKGKSKLSHMLAQELSIGYEKELYVLAKAIDPLGILSHTGILKKAGALIIADADFKTTKGPLSAEEVKSIFDVQEGGTVQQTRYRPANFGGGGELPRIFNMNGSTNDMGSFFRKYDMHGIASCVESLAAGEFQKAADDIRSLDGDTQAQIRRFAVALCVEDGLLVTEATIATLRADAKERAPKRQRNAA